jgi:hypothetical protein
MCGRSLLSRQTDHFKVKAASFLSFGGHGNHTANGEHKTKKHFLGEYKAKIWLLEAINESPTAKKVASLQKKTCNVTFVVAHMTLLGYSFLAEFSLYSKERKSMTSSSMKIRSLILGAALAAVATYSVASPLSIPPMPPANPSVTAFASPLSIPPMPPANPSVTAFASPLSIPPMPPANPSVTV